MTQEVNDENEPYPLDQMDSRLQSNFLPGGDGLKRTACGSQPASDNMLNLSFQRPAEPICIYKDVHLTVTAGVSHISGFIPNLAFTNGWMKADAKVGAASSKLT